MLKTCSALQGFVPPYPAGDTRFKVKSVRIGITALGSNAPCAPRNSKYSKDLAIWATDECRGPTECVSNTSDARVLNRIGGWKHTATREGYREQGGEDIAEEAARVRSQIRTKVRRDNDLTTDTG